MPKNKLINLNKDYKITYKLYDNDRLKKISFHNKLMYPLYVQVIYNRFNITFKSYYFDLFSKAKYALKVAGKSTIPDIKEIIKKEQRVIDFVIEKNRSRFSLDIFKEEYVFYSRDLLDILEDDFLQYLFIFLNDAGLSSLADVVKRGSPGSKLFDLVLDMKSALNRPLYNRLIENSFYLAPPYLPLSLFALQEQKNSLLSLSVLDWQDNKLQGQFIGFFKKHYPDMDVNRTLEKIEKEIRI